MLLLPVASLWFRRGSFRVLTSCSGSVRPSWKNNRQLFRQCWRAEQTERCPEDYTAPPFPWSYCTVHPQWKVHLSVFLPSPQNTRIKSKIMFILKKVLCYNIGMTLCFLNEKWKQRKEGTITHCCSHALESINSFNRNRLLELRRPSAVVKTPYWAWREEFEVWSS